MNTMSDQEQSATATIGQQMEQSQQLKIKDEQQPQSPINLKIPSEEDTAQCLDSLDPTSTAQPFQQQDCEQIDKHMNDWSHEHVQIIEQDNPQFIQYKGQVIVPGTTLLHPTTDVAMQAISQEKAISFPAEYTISPTTTSNESLVVDQLDVPNNRPYIEHNETQQLSVPCFTGRMIQRNAEVIQFSPWHQFNLPFPRRFTWATPRIPPLLNYMRPHLLRSIRPKFDYQKHVQATMYVQNPLQQCYSQTMVQRNDGAVQHFGKVINDTATSAIKPYYVDMQPNMAEKPIGMVEDNKPAVDSNQNEQQNNNTCSSQTSTGQRPFSPQSQTSVIISPVISSESLKTAIVQAQETVTTVASLDLSETTSSILPNEENSKNIELPKALIKPQVLTHVIEGYVIQESDQPFSEIISPSASPNINSGVDNNSGVTLSEPMNKKVKLNDGHQENVKIKIEPREQEYPEISEDNSKSKQSNQINENNWECESSCSVSVTSSSSDLFNQIQNIKTYLPPELASKNPITWTVKEVRTFIVLMVNCDEMASKFEFHEIDGQALMLLKMVHLIGHMKIKLGPALKLFAALNAIRAEVQGFQSPESL